MPTDAPSSSVSSEALRRRHEAREPHLRYALIIGASVVVMLAGGLLCGGVAVHYFATERSMQPMAALGVVHAPDLKPLERFPLPHLEIDDGHAQVITLNEQQNQKLNSYGWIDRSNGVVHIPIERAMDLLLARGLPARTNGVSQTGVSALQLIQERPQQP